MAFTRVVYGGTVSKWKVAGNIFNKQTRRADKGSLPAWVLGEMLTTASRKTGRDTNIQDSFELALIYLGKTCKRKMTF